MFCCWNTLLSPLRSGLVASLLAGLPCCELRTGDVFAPKIDFSRAAPPNGEDSPTAAWAVAWAAKADAEDVAAAKEADCCRMLRAAGDKNSFALALPGGLESIVLAARGDTAPRPLPFLPPEPLPLPLPPEPVLPPTPMLKPPAPAFTAVEGVAKWKPPLWREGVARPAPSSSTALRV